MTESMSLGVVILAAGASSRLGRPKQLLLYKEKQLLQHVIDLACELPCLNCTVVLGANSDLIRRQIDLSKTSMVINSDWHLGMASSIASGLKSLQEKVPSIDYALFLLSDQPYLSSDFLSEMLVFLKQNKPLILSSKYADQIGVPALFHKSLFSELEGLKGDQGAKKTILSYLDKTLFIDFEKGEIDIDTEEEYAALIGR